MPLQLLALAGTLYTASLAAVAWGWANFLGAGGIEVTGPTVASSGGIGILAGGYVYMFRKFLNGEWVVRDVAKAETEANKRVDKVTDELRRSTLALENCNVQSEAHRDLIKMMAERVLDTPERRVRDEGHDPDRRRG